jgi:hypothetical protein
MHHRGSESTEKEVKREAQSFPFHSPLNEASECLRRFTSVSPVSLW